MSDQPNRVKPRNGSRSDPKAWAPNEENARNMMLSSYHCKPPQLLVISMLMNSRLQGPSIEIAVGTGIEPTCWFIPVALATKHSGYLRVAVSKHMQEGALTLAKIVLADRDTLAFRIFVQWMYFNTLPTPWDLSRLSTGKDISTSFLLWTLGDFLEANAFKNEIMDKLYWSYSLDNDYNAIDFVELTSVEVEYAWQNTAAGFKLRIFIVDILSHHITFGDYIRIHESGDWYKLLVKYPELQLQLIAKVADSPNKWTSNVTHIPGIETYLEAVSDESQRNINEALKL
ncbi:hypothetical protein E8E13_011210 [Curvularia kusanoi]|uniref:Uncharacterized protein n=1 Tax=Curvularia kusanoi TaxID=90978 RepID=A0A9P4TP71_CURKU|nr:hypothetical protein E8E13_011210 [Curvularia kusanoi]